MKLSGFDRLPLPVVVWSLPAVRPYRYCPTGACRAVHAVASRSPVHRVFPARPPPFASLHQPTAAGKQEQQQQQGTEGAARQHAARQRTLQSLASQRNAASPDGRRSNAIRVHDSALQELASLAGPAYVIFVVGEPEAGAEQLVQQVFGVSLRQAAAEARSTWQMRTLSR